MRRTINFTGRKRILEQDAKIKLIPLGDGLSSFDAELRLDGYGLPSLARVFVEAFERTRYQRFSYGVVGALKPPPKSDRVLTEFRGCELIRFRVKVVSAQERAGTLLGEADGITPRLPGEAEHTDRLSLLHVKPAEIGDLVWKLNYPDGPNGSVVLLINQSIPDYSLLVQTPSFSSLVLPQILREVLMRVLVSDPCDITSLGEDADEESWSARWVLFARSLVSEEELPSAETGDNDACLRWIDSAVGAFARRQKSISNLIEASGELN